MRAVIQRVSKSRVVVDGNCVGEIGAGLCVLLCAMDGDTQEQARVLAKKIAQLRIFCDENAKMNLDIRQIGGGVLLISQFTLAADTRKGNRPSFTNAAPPNLAKSYYEDFADLLRENGVAKVETGIFAADMQVEIVNDGPVTICLDTDLLGKK
ncbi:MAG: D-aminoacyl-tRNA deacylase [Oscillospiraceae bacterium]|nr:D-aminoacyl-tRNA deacylase [Oscillospiraceae bacterium]